MADRPQPLEPSPLGTKDYWDKVYGRELANHADNPADEGTIWFADSAAEEKMLQYLEHLPLGEAGTSNVDNDALRILDLGTGNGHMLFALRDEEWNADLVGVDYSEASTALARRIQEGRASQQSEAREIRFEVFDILKGGVEGWRGEGFDVVLDKGTFDAISLSGARDEAGMSGAEAYSGRVQSLIRPRGFLLVTSCNWTTPELRKWLEGPGLTYHGAVRYPSFRFGGHEGQSVSSACFSKT